MNIPTFHDGYRAESIFATFPSCRHPLFRSQPMSQRVEAWEKLCQLCAMQGMIKAEKINWKRILIHIFPFQLFLTFRNVDIYHSLRLMVNGRTLREEMRWGCQLFWVPQSLQPLQYARYNILLIAAHLRDHTVQYSLPLHQTHFISSNSGYGQVSILFTNILIIIIRFDLI